MIKLLKPGKEVMCVDLPEQTPTTPHHAPASADPLVLEASDTSPPSEKETAPSTMKGVGPLTRALRRLRRKTSLLEEAFAQTILDPQPSSGTAATAIVGEQPAPVLEEVVEAPPVFRNEAQKVSPLRHKMSASSGSSSDSSDSSSDSSSSSSSSSPSPTPPPRKKIKPLSPGTPEAVREKAIYRTEQEFLQSFCESMSECSATADAEDPVCTIIHERERPTPSRYAPRRGKLASRQVTARPDLKISEAEELDATIRELESIGEMLETMHWAVDRERREPAAHITSVRHGVLRQTPACERNP